MMPNLKLKQLNLQKKTQTKQKLLSFRFVSGPLIHQIQARHQLQAGGLFRYLWYTSVIFCVCYSGCAKDVFFYSLVYDNQQKSLIADHGEIRVGQRYQVEIIPDKLESRTYASVIYLSLESWL